MDFVSWLDSLGIFGILILILLGWFFLSDHKWMK